VTNQTIALPDLPDGCATPEYRPLWLPIDKRAYVLLGGKWRKADSVIQQGGAELSVDTKRRLRAFARECIRNSGGDPDPHPGAPSLPCRYGE
jgi:hypothetical protein